jgi:limonene 1,2-monooxygenase
MLGLDALRQREMMDEALGVILDLLRGEQPVTYQSDWINLNEAQLQLRPYQEPMMPVAVASTISPSGMTAAGKHGVGVLSIASHTQEGLRALPTQWSYAEKAAAEAGRPPPDRKNWRALMVCHLAEDKDEAVNDVVDGVKDWNNYLVNTGSPNGIPIEDGRQIVEMINSFGGGVIGTPDEAITKIQALLDVSGGFGCLLVFATEWANTEKTLKSYELFARYVMPKFQDSLSWLDRTWDWTNANKEELAGRTRGSIMKAINANADAKRMMEEEMAKAQQARAPKEEAPSS